ncbi:MAG: XRE family transcriptional regulator [Bacteroidia bacterium]
MFISKNIAFLRKRRELTQQQLADILSITRTAVTNYELGKSVPEFETFIALCKYFDVTLDDMTFKRLDSNQNLRKAVTNSAIIELNPSAKANCFISDQKASAGFGRLIENPKLIEQLPAITLPNAPHGLNIAFQITGDSMHPTVRHLDYVSGNQINDVKDIRNGYTYVLVDKDDGIIYKRIYKERAGIRIVSDNPDYPPYMRETDSILAYFKAFCRLSFDFRPYYDDIRKDLHQLQKDVDWLKGKVK